MCIFFHKWSKWKRYEANENVILVGFLYPKDVRGRQFTQQETRQRRTCECCGKVQDILIK